MVVVVSIYNLRFVLMTKVLNMSSHIGALYIPASPRTPITYVEGKVGTFMLNNYWKFKKRRLALSKIILKNPAINN